MLLMRHPEHGLHYAQGPLEEERMRANGWVNGDHQEKPIERSTLACIGGDPTCPCQDGDACHYRDAADGTKAMPIPDAPTKRKPGRPRKVQAV